MIEITTIIGLTIGILILVFVIWMLVDMWSHKKIRKSEKGLWTIFFIILSLLTAIIWAIVRPRKKKKRGKK